jgi:Ran GTPase-activating protein (RanGAP) involved in mRNA processing and transport
MLNHLPLTFWRRYIFNSQDLKNISAVCTDTYKIVQALRRSRDFSFASRILKIPPEWISSVMLFQLKVTLDRFVQRCNLTEFTRVKHIVYFSSGEADDFYRICQVIPTEFYISVYFNSIRSENYNGLLMNTFRGLGNRFISFNLQDNNLNNSSAESMIECLEHTPFLEELNLSNNCFLLANLEKLTPKLYMLHNLRDLNISGNIINIKNAQTLAPALKYMTGLLKLDMCGIHMGNISLNILSKSIMCMTKLEYLNLGSNWTGSESQGDLALILQSLPNLKDLDLSYSEIGTTKMNVLAPVICNLSKLKRLNLRGNEIGEYFETQIPLFKIPTLEFLDISLNRLTSKGVARLAESLETMTSLTHLSLKNNEVGTEGCILLSSSIKKLKRMATLDIGHFVDSDLSPLIVSLSSLPNLTSLDMSCNQRMSDINALGGLSNLVCLNISDNNLGEEGAAELSISLSKMSRLTSLNLNANGIFDIGLISLLESISSLVNLETIMVGYNYLESESVVALGNHLQSLTSLQLLDLSNNEITESDIEYLKSKLSGKNSCLEIIE